ncbi:hypothetical protein HYDPIDRAFT_118556 [Hydnomerulius pinastri MD-312]|uniref:Uncharacterized protein n=1 Tax=Hydnomerulius pinastri MD-312 TaxID=994086 RepID=A0A0C9W6X5_9AGAM|nr:hypothetical protein HYDPIDRAFT_119439 [Hydnomerulius pinastri MD-312]KIJ59445.1 hypothetical protein HYDPIDRAFT_118556 [Hydnomerulius pinastri MD-312]
MQCVRNEVLLPTCTRRKNLSWDTSRNDKNLNTSRASSSLSAAYPLIYTVSQPPAPSSLPENNANAPSAHSSPGFRCTGTISARITPFSSQFFLDFVDNHGKRIETPTGVIASDGPVGSSDRFAMKPMGITCIRTWCKSSKSRYTYSILPECTRFVHAESW